MRDTEKRKFSLSMDDLMVRTIGMIDTLPDRIEKLEVYVRELENRFARHEGEQDQGIKRISDRISNMEKNIRDLHEESLNQIKELKSNVSLLNDIEGLTSDQKLLIQNLKETVSLLENDYTKRENVKKTFKHYIASVLDYFLRYAMLPVTIVVLLFLGFAPDVIPGYKGESTLNIMEEKFNFASVELMMFNNKDQINESDLNYWMSVCHKDLILISNENDINKAITTNLKNNKKHFFVWIPDNSNNGGYVQIIGINGRKIGSEISILRGK